MKRSKFFAALSVAVASGSTIKQAATVANCQVATAYAISATIDFRDEVSRLKSESVQRAVAILATNATLASQTLVELLTDDDPKIRLAAASKLLATVAPLSEFAEMRDRLDALETGTVGLKVAQ